MRKMRQVSAEELGGLKLFFANESPLKFKTHGMILVDVLHESQALSAHRRLWNR